MGLVLQRGKVLNSLLSWTQLVRLDACAKLVAKRRVRMNECLWNSRLCGAPQMPLANTTFVFDESLDKRRLVLLQVSFAAHLVTVFQLLVI